MIILNENTIDARILASKIAKPGELIVPNDMPKEIAVSPSMAKKVGNYPGIAKHPVLDLKNVTVFSPKRIKSRDGQAIYFFHKEEDR